MYTCAQRANILRCPVNGPLLTYGSAFLRKAKGTTGAKEFGIELWYSIVHGEGGISAVRTLEAHCIAHFVICRHELNDFFHCLFQTILWYLAEFVTQEALFFFFWLLYVGYNF